MNSYHLMTFRGVLDSDSFWENVIQTYLHSVCSHLANSKQCRSLSFFACFLKDLSITVTDVFQFRVNVSRKFIVARGKKVLESLKFSSMVMEANDESSSISPIFMLLFARSSG